MPRYWVRQLTRLARFQSKVDGEEFANGCIEAVGWGRGHCGCSARGGSQDQGPGERVSVGSQLHCDCHSHSSLKFIRSLHSANS